MSVLAFGDTNVFDLEGALRASIWVQNLRVCFDSSHVFNDFREQAQLRNGKRFEQYTCVPPALSNAPNTRQRKRV